MHQRKSKNLGIKISSLKEELRESPLRFAAIPITSYYPLIQHDGKEALPVVRVGDRVEEGMLLAKATATQSINIHSAVPGVVRAIKEQVDLKGKKTSFIEIATGGRFKVQSLENIRDYSGWTKQQILAEIAMRGLVDMGGNAQPLHSKWTQKEPVEVLIIEAVEQEPYLASDHRLLVERMQEIINGIVIAVRLLEPKKIVISSYKSTLSVILQMIESLQALAPTLVIEPLLLKERYPQSAAKLLVYYATGTRLGVKETPESVGCMIVNIATFVAVYEALAFAKPLVERAITVSGKGIVAPSNLIAKFGTPIKFLIEECGGITQERVTLIAHGPMLGRMVIDEQTPLTKEMAGILALLPQEVKSSRSTACIGCNACRKACPLNLAPKEMYYSILSERPDKAIGYGLNECINCGACSFSCPARIELSHTFRCMQSQIAQEEAYSNQKRDH
ncbi:RnfABCDGE type electron transport complex subunit C [Entomospira entomophila]|uniref:Ion-translocating oxidoreductase complex subunit C n=1 Tax=Entomospira entomophila TaxID=2719988 RepID=A0A968GAQ6_9SPIO|nr:RnfABCDGE type electron transport complex subunit C [Entomospira entomophilus]NIZ41181.1 RnfABCDGE type electron transport complex subunit C [Entomospira entomophilus]WDI35388.1 RnfABCDGE type electron transport complex subunit C [Entomospira entomophilus]